LGWSSGLPSKKLAALALFDQLGSILEGSRPIESLAENFSDQGARRCMITTHASMDIEQYFTTLFLSDALHQDSVTPLSVELAVYLNVELGFTRNFFLQTHHHSGCLNPQDWLGT
jgi:hypothetical protein